MQKDRKWTRLTPNSFSNKAGYNEVPQKVMGQKNKVQVLKKHKEENNFSFCPSAQLLTDVYLGISESARISPNKVDIKKVL